MKVGQLHKEMVAGCVLAADFRKDALRMYTSIAANFFEGLNYAFIEASCVC